MFARILAAMAAALAACRAAAQSEEVLTVQRAGYTISALAMHREGGRYAVQEWTFVGTSEGSISAYHAARMNPKLASRLILTSSLFEASRNGPDVDDACRFTPYAAAQRAAQRSGKPLVTVRGGGQGRGDACQPFRAHGYVGIERPTVEAMRQWVKTGSAPAEVTR